MTMNRHQHERIPNHPPTAHTTSPIDPENPAEQARLVNQAMFLRDCLGLFPPLVEPQEHWRVLDLACGPGIWAHEVAFAHPHMQILGVDLSQTLIASALLHARLRNLGNLSFEVMDLMQPLPLPDASFDYVNARFLAGFMRPEAWGPLLQELILSCILLSSMLR